MSPEDKKEFLKRVLSPLKATALNRMKILGFDVETEHIDKIFIRADGVEETIKEQAFTCGSVVGADTQKVFYNIEDMQRYMLGRDCRKTWFYATNLEFDFNVLFSKRLFDFYPVYRNGLRAAIWNNPKMHGDKRYFIGTENFLNIPLKRLGAIFGLEKLDHPSTMTKTKDGLGLQSRRPKNHREWNELVKYNLNDSFITYTFAENLRRFCTEHNIRLKLTAASTGLDYIRRNHMDVPMVREPDEICDLHFLGSYKGGMTVCYKRGMYDDKIWYYDLRSAFPWACYHGVDGKGSYPLPGSYRVPRHPDLNYIRDYEGISEVEVDYPYEYAPLLANKTDKLRFVCGRFRGWHTHYELRQIMDKADIKPIRTLYYTKTFKPFRECIKQLYALRCHYKAKRHPYEQMIKLVMNSGIYGKWGLNYNNMEELIDPDRCYYADDGHLMVDGVIIEDASMSSGGVFNVIKKKVKPMRYSMPILSSYTSAIARVKLWQSIRHKQKHIIYTDTDSAIMTAPVLDTGSQLGDWELERTPDGGIFIRPKLYMLYEDDKTTIRAKGIGGSVRSRTDFIRAIRNRYAPVERFSKMKESSRRGMISGSVIRLCKDIGLEDDKRIWQNKRFKIERWEDSESICV